MAYYAYLLSDDKRIMEVDLGWIATNTEILFWA
jgi:hypothetical protein